MIIDFAYTIILLLIAMQFPAMLLQPSERAFFPLLRRLIGFHFLLGIAYYFFTRNGGGDAWGYWLNGKNLIPGQFMELILKGGGTHFMHAFNSIPASVLGMGFFANTMFYSLLGALGVCYFFIITIRTVPNNSQVKGYYLFPLIFYLPNLHFWSSGVGKDTVLFLCIAMFVYAIMSPVRRIPLILISILLSAAVRPHITFMLVLSYGIAYLLGSKAPAWQRMLFSLAFIGLGILLLPKVLEIARMDELSAEEFEAFSTSQASALSQSHTGSAIDISSYPFPLKVLTFLFRPFFFDARSITGLLASVENLFLIILFVKIFANSPVQAFRAAPFIIKGFVIFLILGTIAFSLSLGNVGIMIRMKNMFLPGLLIFILWVFSYQQEKEEIYLSQSQ